MSELEDRRFEFETHIEMWKHYNTLRQSKNSGFLTANSILAAITGFLFKEPKSVGLMMLIILISFVGIVVCVAWFLLLKRNAAYIKYHRTLASGGDEHFWEPQRTGTPHSTLLERTPSVAFIGLWVGFLIFASYFLHLLHAT
jgi:hypothetical protein